MSFINSSETEPNEFFRCRNVIETGNFRSLAWSRIVLIIAICSAELHVGIPSEQMDL